MNSASGQRGSSGVSGTVTVLGNDLYREVSGAGGVPVLLLHGGYCGLDHLQHLADALAHDRVLHAYERPGHGRSPDVDGPFDYDAGEAEAVAYLDVHGLGAVDVVGYSDGAIIGLLLAMRHPDRVRALVAISGNLSPEAFGEDASGASEDADDGEQRDPVLAKLMHLWRTEPHIDPAALAAVTAPVLVVSGDRDVVPPDHSRLMAASLPRGQVRIVENASHDLTTEHPRLVADLVRGFLDGA